MFDFFSMMDNYEDRKVARYEKGDVFVSTAYVTDSEHSYETAIAHPQYNDNKIIIIAVYDTQEEAEQGHEHWVAVMTAEELPSTLRDVSTAMVAELLDALTDEDWREQRITGDSDIPDAFKDCNI